MIFCESHLGFDFILSKFMANYEGGYAMEKVKPARRIKGIEYAIREVVVLANQVKATGKEMFYLNIGDPNMFGFEPPRHMVEAVFNAIKQNQNGYSPSNGIAEAVDAIKRQAERNGIKNVLEVIVSMGASEGIDLAITGLVNSGDNLLLPYPSYSLYGAILGKLEVEANPYYLNEENDWNLDVADIEGRINDRTKGIVIINPNNPTGAVYPKETLLELLDLARRRNLVIFSDEIYDKLTFDKEFVSIASLADDVPVVTFNGLSKSYIVPGWRIGWVIFSGPKDVMADYVEGVNKMARSRLSASHPMQWAIKPALDGPQDHIKAMMDILRVRRDLTVKMLNEIPEISCTVPQGAFYAFPKLNIPEDDVTFVSDLIRETGVVTVYGSGFGQKPETQHLRIVFLPNEQILDKAYTLIRDFVKKRYHN